MQIALSNRTFATQKYKHKKQLASDFLIFLSTESTLVQRYTLLFYDEPAPQTSPTGPSQKTAK
jgi:hypothetical protein